MEAKKQKLAYFWAAITVIVVILLAVLLPVAGGKFMLIFLGIANLIFGPICAILYIMEVKKGVFNVDDEEE